jgi:pilus assembly protein CpaE
VKDTFLRHSSGLRVLLAPDDVSAVETIEPGQVTRALEQLRGHFDIVVCDLWSMYEQLTRDVLRMSDQLILVTTPDLPSLRDLRRVLLTGREDLRLDERATIVVNRASGKAGFSLAEVNKVLGRPASFAIPSDGAAVTEAVNRGLSVMDTRVRTKVTKVYRELAAQIGAVPGRGSAGAQLTVARART